MFPNCLQDLQKKKRLFTEDTITKIHTRCFFILTVALSSWIGFTWNDKNGQINCSIPYKDITQSQINTYCINNIIDLTREVETEDSHILDFG